jgi:sulfate permease, SulP family
VLAHLLGKRHDAAAMALKLFAAMRPLTRGAMVRDAMAGMALASLSVPQVLGYARIAGAPVVTGLYTLLLPPLAFAAFGSSRHLVVAADSATAAILASALSRMAEPAGARYMALVGIVALLTAGMLLLARAFRLGFLADFLSRTVLVGFLAGVGIQVGITVLGDMLGIAVVAHGTPQRLLTIYRNLASVHAPTLALSIAALACLFAGRRWLPRVPVALAVAVTGIAMSATFGFAAHGVAVLGPISGGLPSLGLPALGWDDVVTLLPVAASCFVIIVAQSAAASRAFAVLHHERVDADADIGGLAAANAAAALSGTFVVNGSPTQTAMSDRAGARSQFVQVSVAAVVVIVLLFFTQWLQYLPRCVLAAIVFSIAVGLIDMRALLDIRRESPGEFALAVGTAAMVAVVGVEHGLLVAIAVSLLRHVRQSYRPHTTVLAPGPTGRWMPVPALPGVQTEPGLIVYHFGADLFYANETRFSDEVRALVAHAPSPVHWFLVEASAITALDYSAARSVRDVCEELERAGVEVVFARVNVYLRADMQRHGILAAVGTSRVFATLHDALEAVHHARGQKPATDLPRTIERISDSAH